MIPGGMTRSPCRPTRRPFFVFTSSTNFNDSSEISKPKEGVERKAGTGKNLRKNLLNKLLNIPILYDILVFLATILRPLFNPSADRNPLICKKKIKLAFLVGNRENHALAFNPPDHPRF